jgi:polysaccharide biosynthesis/export protein
MNRAGREFVNLFKSPLRPGFFAAAGIFTLALIQTGCMSTPNLAESWPAPKEPIAGLQPGDVIEVKYLYWPEMDTAQTVRPDGAISLQMVQDVHVAGMTPAEVRDQLLVLYADKLKDPDITVHVEDFGSHRVFVGGEVLRPGVLPINGKLTLLEAIMQAGGFVKETARKRHVVLLREREGGRFGRTYNMREVLQSSESDPVYLEPYDVIFVPRSHIDQFNQWTDQYINNMIPEKLNYTFYHEVHREPQKNADAALSYGF